MTERKKIEDIKNINLFKKYNNQLTDTVIISNMNFKGGSGKTATTALQAYELSKNNFNVLVIDNDPQANLTEYLLQDKGFEKDISDMILENEPIDNCILNIKENLDIIPASLNYVYLDDINRNNTSIYNLLKIQIDKIKEKYDFIFIDVPPSININLKLALHSCTHINLVVQTKMPSFYGSQKLISWLETYLDKNNIDVNLTGIIQTLTDTNKNKHEEVREVISDYYGDLAFKNYVPYSDRMDYFNNYGITEKDYWSIVTLNNFNILNDEMLSRL